MDCSEFQNWKHEYFKRIMAYESEGNSTRDLSQELIVALTDDKIQAEYEIWLRLYKMFLNEN